MECPFREKMATSFIFVLHSAHLGRFVPQVTESSEVCRMIYLVTKHKTEGSCLLKKNSNQLNYDFIKKLFFIK